MALRNMSLTRKLAPLALLSTVIVGGTITAASSTAATTAATVAPGVPVINDFGSGAMSGVGNQWTLGNANLKTDATGTGGIVYGTTANYSHNTGQQTWTGTKQADGSYKAVIGGQIKGLTAGVTYHYAVIVSTANGTTISADKTFVAAGHGIPVINQFGSGPLNTSGSQWTLGNANLRADATGTGGVVYGTTANYSHNTGQQTWTGTKQADGSYKAVIGGQIHGLTPGVTYHYAVIVSTEHGTAISADKTFVAR